MGMVEDVAANLYTVFNSLMMRPEFAAATFLFCPESGMGMTAAYLERELRQAVGSHRVVTVTEGSSSNTAYGCLKNDTITKNMCMSFCALLKTGRVRVWEHCIYLTNCQYAIGPGQSRREAIAAFLSDELRTQLALFKDDPKTLSQKYGQENDQAIAEMMVWWVDTFFHQPKYAHIDLHSDFHTQAVVLKHTGEPVGVQRVVRPNPLLPQPIERHPEPERTHVDDPVDQLPDAKRIRRLEPKTMLPMPF